MRATNLKNCSFRFNNKSAIQLNMRIKWPLNEYLVCFECMCARWRWKSAQKFQFTSFVIIYEILVQKLYAQTHTTWLASSIQPIVYNFLFRWRYKNKNIQKHLLNSPTATVCTHFRRDGRRCSKYLFFVKRSGLYLLRSEYSTNVIVISISILLPYIAYNLYKWWRSGPIAINIIISNLIIHFYRHPFPRFSVRINTHTCRVQTRIF